MKAENKTSKRIWLSEKQFANQQLAANGREAGNESTVLFRLEICVRTSTYNFSKLQKDYFLINCKATKLQNSKILKIRR